MATVLNENERARVRYFLGYPNLAFRFLVEVGVPRVNPTALTLENHMRNILDDESVLIIREILEQIEDSRKNLVKAKDRLKAARIIGAVDLNPREIEMLWQEDYRLCTELSITLNVPIYRHPAMKRGFIEVSDNPIDFNFMQIQG